MAFEASPSHMASAIATDMQQILSIASFEDPNHMSSDILHLYLDTAEACLQAQCGPLSAWFSSGLSSPLASLIGMSQMNKQFASPPSTRLAALD